MSVLIARTSFLLSLTISFGILMVFSLAIMDDMSIFEKSVIEDDDAKNNMNKWSQARFSSSKISLNITIISR